MGIKSYPENMPFCIGYCKYKNDKLNTGQCVGCVSKSHYKDCREECANYAFKCKGCDDAELFKDNK